MGSATPLHDVAGTAGVELTDYLGRVAEPKPAEGRVPPGQAGRMGAKAGE